MARLEFYIFAWRGELLARKAFLTKGYLRIERAVNSYTDATKKSWRFTPIELPIVANWSDRLTLNAHPIIGFLHKRHFLARSPWYLCRGPFVVLRVACC
jgi:hypothetical protein